MGNAGLGSLRGKKINAMSLARKLQLSAYRHFLEQGTEMGKPQQSMVVSMSRRHSDHSRKSEVTGICVAEYQSRGSYVGKELQKSA